MVNIKVKILGDPQLIKQDDLFYGQNVRGSLSQLTPNGSLFYDNGELYVFFNFQSPTDYDETTGLAVPQLSEYQYSAFSGIYKIIKVDNVFTRGKFEQTLDLVRLPISDNLRNQQTNARARVDSYTNFGLGQLASLPYARFTGPNILVNALSTGGQLVNAGLATASGIGTALIGGIINQAISQSIGKAADYISNKVSGLFKTNTFSTNPEVYKGDAPTATQYGAFGEDPTGAAETLNGADLQAELDAISADAIESSEILSLETDYQLNDIQLDVAEFEIEIPEDLADFFG